jgi:glycosyltransferase involved in cell wall biosynthesis
MKIVYLSSPSFFDMDLSLTKELFKQSDLYFFLDLPVYSRNSTALNFKTLLSKSGIYPATLFIELREFSEFLNLNKTFVIYRTSKKTYSLSNIILQYKLTNKIKYLNPEIIHCNNFLDFNFTYLLITNKSKKIITVHDPVPHSGEYSKKDTAIRKFNYRFFKNIILLNQSQTDLFILNSGKKLKNIFYSRLGAYTFLKKFNQEKEYKRKKNQILMFGRISPYKGIEELCKAFRFVISEFSDAKLIIAGSGKFNFNITEYLQSPNYIFINRYIPNNELVQLIQESQFVVCPYLDATQSGVIMTSFALDQPVVATNVGGLKEMVISNKTGLLIKPNNVSQITDSIKWMLENPNAIEEMRKNIKNLNNKGILSWNKIAHDLISIYSKLD